MGKNFSLLDLIDADKPKELNVDERFCEIHHNKKVKFYCQADKAFVCSECLLQTHIGHDIVAAKPLILGEEVQDSLTLTTEIIQKLKEMSEPHLKKI